MTREELISLALSKFAYWRDQEPADDNGNMIQLGAIAAASNIFAALCGHPAKWHTLRPNPNAKIDELRKALTECCNTANGALVDDDAQHDALLAVEKIARAALLPEASQ